MIRWLTRTLGTLAALAAWLCLAAWCAGRVLTDTTQITQYLSWAPGWGAGLAVFALGLVGMVLRRLGRPRREYHAATSSTSGPEIDANGPASAAGGGGGAVSAGAGQAGSRRGASDPERHGPRAVRRRRRRRIPIATIAAFLGLSLVGANFEPLRLCVWKVLPRDAAPEAARETPPRTLRIVQWNSSKPGPWNWTGILSALRPGMIAPVASSRPALDAAETVPWADVFFLSHTMTGDEYAQFVGSLPDTYTSRRWINFTVASRVPVLAMKSFSLRLAESTPRKREAEITLFQKLYNKVMPRLGISRRVFDAIEDGSLVVTTLDTRTELGRETVVYFIDLPSDPFLWKMATARAAAARIRELQQANNLPAADILLGDSNTPRGSASLEELTRAAFADNVTPVHAAGSATLATWPRAHPAFHIDHCYLIPELRAARYGVVDPGVSDHMAQVVEVAR